MLLAVGVAAGFPAVALAAFPTVESVTETESSQLTTTHNVSMPATVNAGDLLLILITVMGGDGTISVTEPSGWTERYYESYSTQYRAILYARIADGTEGGTTVTVSTNNISFAAAQAYRISGWGASLDALESSQAAGSSGTSPDPPSLNPSAWGVEDTLWLAVAHFSSSPATVSAYPSNYSNGSSIKANTPNTASARRENAVESEDPGTFTLSTSSLFLSTTIAIRPAAGGDDTPPALTNASAVGTGTTTADLSVDTDEDNGTLYTVVTQSATAPSAAQVKAGQDHTGSAAAFADDQSISSTGTKTFNASGLSPGTTYYAHFMHEDDAENQSDVASSGAFITDGGATAVLLRLDRMKASTATGGTVCFTPATNGTEASVQVAFPSDFTVNGTAGNWTVDTDALPLGAAAWTGIDTATGVSGQVVTFPSGDLSVGTLYCFNFSGTNTLTTGSAGSDKAGSITTRTSAPATIDSAQYAVAIISDDQITINATVPATFSFDLSASSDAFQSDLSASSVVSTGGIDATIATNAANGWIVWLKSANAGLDSTTTGDSINTQGTLNGACTELVEGSDYYQLSVEIDTDSGTGTGTVSIDDEYDCDHDGDPWTGGTFATSYAEIATADGTTDGDVITLYGLATISAVKPAATDYTDTWTVVGAGLF